MKPQITRVLRKGADVALAAGTVACGISVLWLAILFAGISSDANIGVADPNQLYVIEHPSGGIQVAIPYWSFEEARRLLARTDVIQSGAALRPITVILETPTERREISAGIVTDTFGHTTGLRPVIGVVSDHEACTVGEGLSRECFGASQAAIGRTLRLSGIVATVSGVMTEAAVRSFGGARLLLPLQSFARLLAPGELQGDGYQSFAVFVRLRPSVSVHDATVALSDVLHPSRTGPQDGNLVVRLTSFTDHVLGPHVRAAILAVIGAAILVLITACGNGVALTASIFERDRKHYAIKAAIGASPGRLVVEPVLFGAAVGGVAWGVSAVLAGRAAEWLGALSPFTIHIGRPLLLSFLVAIAAGIAITLTAAWPAIFRGGTITLLRVDAPVGRRKARTRGRSELLCIETAFCAASLVVAATAIARFDELVDQRLGFDSAGIDCLRMSVPASTDLDSMPAIYAESTNAINSLPGVQALALADDIPIDRYGLGMPLVDGSSVRIDDGRSVLNGTPDDAAMAPLRHRVSASYFGLLHIPLREGRLFSRTEGKGGPLVAVVNRRFAKAFWPNEGALGHQITFERPVRGSLLKGWREIVGVVEDVRFNGPSFPTRPEVYIPIEQDAVRRFALIAARKQPSGLTLQAASSALRTVPAVVIASIDTLDSIVTRSTRTVMFVAAAFGIIALLAITLTCIGAFAATGVRSLRS